MHEFGVAAALLEAVQARANGRAVRALRVHVGALQRLDRAVFDEAFALVAGGGVADGAEVEIVEVAARLACRGCAREHTTGGGMDPRDVVLGTTCEGCGGHDLDLLAGDELLLESITLARPGVAQEVG